ncbi:MAG: hypothetical protein HY794_16305 [Desulfarculus sp.]|nr:hypothetical protein [Desulfarculus sp.]
MRWPRTMLVRSVFFPIICLALLAALPAGAEQAKPSSQGLPLDTVDGIYQGPASTKDKHKFIINDQPQELAVPAYETRKKMASAKAGDKVSMQLDSITAPSTITKIEKISRPVSRKHRLMAIAASLLGLFLIALLFSQGNPAKFILGKDNRYSNSQVQMTLWFAVTATIYCSALALRYFKFDASFLGGIDIPDNLLILSGLSAFSYGGAKMITAQKVQNAEKAAAAAKASAPAAPAAPAAVAAGAATAPAAPAAAAVPPVAQKTRADSPNIFSDLVRNDSEEYDLGDFQMLLVSLAAVIIFAVTGYHFLGSLPVEVTTKLPDVDTTLLSGFGIGQGAYLIKKAAAKLGEG